METTKEIFFVLKFHEKQGANKKGKNPGLLRHLLSFLSIKKLIGPLYFQNSKTKTGLSPN